MNGGSTQVQISHDEDTYAPLEGDEAAGLRDGQHERDPTHQQDNRVLYRQKTAGEQEEFLVLNFCVGGKWKSIQLSKAR